MKTKIVVASSNAGKIAEIREILSNYDVVSAAEVGFNDEIAETGQTFLENALIKAWTVCKATGLAALGDDSGLCVDALNGAPGIFSARYSGQGVVANRKLLLKNLSGQNNRKAYFNCAVALVFPDGCEYTAEGQTYGAITTEVQVVLAMIVCFIVTIWVKLLLWRRLMKKTQPPIVAALYESCYRFYLINLY